MSSPPDFEAALSLLRGRRVVALTGAGCSTESGIPDYRSPGRPPRRPIQYREFVGSETHRARYWARSALGWPRFRAALPNAGHQALATLERAGAVRGLITQNVDRLHQAAGSRRVIDLHGALEEVVCLGCGALSRRDALQARLQDLNPGLMALAAVEAPDGDAELQAPVDFCVPACDACGGVLKPHVVFFGENVPPARYQDACALFDEAEVLLVVGSSLAVFSGYRFVVRAVERGLPVVIVNRGPTRGDAAATLRLSAGIGDLLPELAARLAG